jgi:ABC-type transporter MlaC component
MYKQITASFKSLFAAVQEKFTISENVDLAVFDKMVEDEAKKLAKTLSKDKKEKKVKSKTTVYQLFCAKNRDSSLSFVESTRAVAAKWNELSDEQKEEFKESVKDEMEADAKRYDSDKAAASDEDTTDRKKEHKKKDPNAPKRPLGSYMLFCKDQREKDSSLKGTEASKKMGKMWKELSEEQQQVYKDLASKLLEEFKNPNKDAEAKAVKAANAALEAFESSKPKKEKKNKK